MNWRNTLTVFAAAIVALILYDVAVGPLIAGAATAPKADQ